MMSQLIKRFIRKNFHWINGSIPQSMPFIWWGVARVVKSAERKYNFDKKFIIKKSTNSKWVSNIILSD